MKKIMIILCFVLVLCVVDQGAKIYVTDNFEILNEHLYQVADTIHIHHLINYSAPEEWVHRADTIGLSVSFWKWIDVFESALVSLAIFLFLSFIYKFTVFAGIKKRIVLFGSLMSFFVAASLCGFADRIFWECTHDFICISRTFISDSGKAVIGHSSRDIKDIYLIVVIILFVLWVAFTVIDFFKLPNPTDTIRAYFKSYKTDKLTNTDSGDVM